MADALFEDPRLAAVYDALDPDRSDLDEYVAIVEELDGHSVLDIGCGTGTFALMLAARGIEVVGVDPAGASLDVARSKPGAGDVTWLHGDARDVPALRVDVVTMTANVAQAIVDDAAWTATLEAAYRSLRPGGHLVFETRRPERRAWDQWNPDDSHVAVDIPEVGVVESWHQLVSVELPLVTFESFTRWQSDGAVLTSRSTLRFREYDDVAQAVTAAGFEVSDVRDAPDRPGREWVFIARRPAG